MMYPVEPERTDYPRLAEEVAGGRHRRKVLLVRVRGDEERRDVKRTCARKGLEVLEVTPVWYVLAFNKDVPHNVRLRLARSILDSEVLSDATFRGELFGYSKEAIRWYTNELAEGVKRYEQWRSQ